MMGNPMQEWLRFQKMTLDHSFQSMTQLQDYLLVQMRAGLEQNPLLPAEGRKLIMDWMGAYRKGCDELKARVDGSYEKVEAFFRNKAE